MGTSGWAQESWSTSLLTHHPPVRTKSHHLQPWPQILPKNISSPEPPESSRFSEPKAPFLLVWPCNKPFCALNFVDLMCLASAGRGHTHSHLVILWRAVSHSNYMGFYLKINDSDGRFCWRRQWCGGREMRRRNPCWVVQEGALTMVVPVSVEKGDGLWIYRR